MVACSAAADTGTLLHSTSSPASATAKAGDTRLATVGDTVITAEDLAHRMRSYGDEPGRFNTAESRLRLLQDMVQHQVRVAAARAEGYEHKPEIVAALEGLMASAWERDQLTPKLDEIEVSSDEIAAHYENHAARYTVPEKVRAALIRLEATDEPQELEFMEAEILAAVPGISPNDGVGELARRYSADRAGRYVGGVVGWLVRGDRYRWPTEVVEAVFNLSELGDVAAVSTPGGRYWVRLIERRPATLRPLAEVSDGIQRELVRARREALRDELYQNLWRQFRVDIDTAALERLAPPPPLSPPPVPGGPATISPAPLGGEK